MAESYSISIPVTADLTPFNAQVKAGLEQAVSRGASIPVGGGVGGQGSRTGVSINAAEEAAVNRAFTMAQQTSGSYRTAGGHFPIMGSGGGGAAMSPRIDTNEAQIALRRIQGIADTLRQTLERPIVLRVDTTQVAAAAAMQRAGGGAPVMGAGGAGAAATPPLPQGMARFYHGGVPGGSGKRWFTPDLAYAQGYASKSASGGAVQYLDLPRDHPLLSKAFDDTGTSQTAPYNSFEAPAELANRRRPYITAAQQQAASVASGLPAGAASPNWSYQMSQPAAARAQQQAASVASGLPIGASSPNWSYLMSQPAAARAQQQAASRPKPWLAGGQYGVPVNSLRGLAGFFGVLEINRALGTTRDAESLAQFAGSAEERELILAQGYETAGSGFFGSILNFVPNALDLGGEYGMLASPQRRTREAREQVEIRNRNLARKRAGAARRSERREIRSGVSSLTGRAENLGRRGFDRQYNASDIEYDEQIRALDDDLSNRREQINLAPDPAARTAATLSYNQAAKESAGQRDALARMAIAQRAATAKQEQMERRATLREQPSLRAAAEGQFGLAEQRVFEAGLANAQDAADQQGSPEISQERRNTNLLSREARRAMAASESKSRRASAMANRMRLSRGPEVGAQLVELADEQRAALSAVEPGFEQSVRDEFAGRAALLVQGDQDRRYDINAGLDAAMRQSRARGRGDPVSASLDEIVSATRSDALGLERQSYGNEARKRRRLGQQQVQEFQSSYYRSVEFEEVSGSRIGAGRGFSDVEKKFREAMADAGERGRKEPGRGGGGGTITEQQGEQILVKLQQMIDKHFKARAG